MQNLLWYLIAGSKGGITRGKIINILKKTPNNANKLAKELNLDYKTIRHHLKVLEENNIIKTINKGKYNRFYFLSDIMKENMGVFGEIWERFGKK